VSPRVSTSITSLSTHSCLLARCHTEEVSGIYRKVSTRIEGQPFPRSARRKPGLHRDAAAETIEEWFQAYESDLGKYLVQFVRDRALAEDLLQETFHDAYRASRVLPDIDNPRAWLFGIARNHALRALRRQRRFQRAIARLVLRHEEPAAIDSEAASILSLLERTLTPEDRALVLLRHMYAFDASELAEMTGRSPAAVRQRLSRARKRLLETAAEPDGPIRDERSSK
jgi:RNA polymerase sigma factor (sigma-70 family)